MPEIGVAFTNMTPLNIAIPVAYLPRTAGGRQSSAPPRARMMRSTLDTPFTMQLSALSRYKNELEQSVRLLTAGDIAYGPSLPSLKSRKETWLNPSHRVGLLAAAEMFIDRPYVIEAEAIQAYVKAKKSLLFNLQRHRSRKYESIHVPSLEEPGNMPERVCPYLNIIRVLVYATDRKGKTNRMYI